MARLDPNSALPRPVAAVARLRMLAQRLRWRWRVAYHYRVLPLALSLMLLVILIQATLWPGPTPDLRQSWQWADRIGAAVLTVLIGRAMLRYRP